MSCPMMLRRVAEDAGSLLRMLDRVGIGPQGIARRHPGELAQAVQNCLECFDQPHCDGLSARNVRLSAAPAFCANGRWISEMMAG